MNELISATALATLASINSIEDSKTTTQESEETKHASPKLKSSQPTSALPSHGNLPQGMPLPRAGLSSQTMDQWHFPQLNSLTCFQA